MFTTPRSVRGCLASVGVSPQILVRFQFNPVSVSDKRTITYASLNAPGGLVPTRQYTTGGDRTISFTVTIDGMSAYDPDRPGVAIDQVIDIDEDCGIGPELTKYRALAYPCTPRWQDATDRVDGFTGLFNDEESMFRAPPEVLFGFGSQVVTCLLTEVTITQTLYTPGLVPLRADVAVTLAEVNPYQLAPDGSLL